MRIGLQILTALWMISFNAESLHSADAPVSVPVHQIDATYITDWLVLGPLSPPDSDDASWPSPESLAGIRENAAVQTPDGSELVWRLHRSRRPFVNLYQALGAEITTSVYVYCELNSAQSGEAQFEWTGSPAEVVLVNGTALQPSWAAHSQSRSSSFAVPIREGTNRCLFQVTPTELESGFALRVIPVDRAIVAGTITDLANNAVSGAAIQLLRNGAKVLQTKSDPAGKFRFDIFPPEGSFELRATFEKLGKWRTGVSVKPGDTQTVDLKLEQAVSVSGIVVALDGETPQSGIPVEAIRVGESDNLEKRVATVLTDERGQYAFVALPNGRYRIQCQTRSGYAEFRAPAGSNQLVVASGSSHSADFKIAQVKKGFWRSYSTYDGLPFQNVRSIQPTERGLIYLGLHGGGLCEFNGMEFRRVEALTEFRGGNVFSIARDRSDALWIAGGEGLFRFDGIHSQKFTVEDGLAGGSCQVVVVDRLEAVWAGCRFGLSRFNQQEFETYEIKDGLPANWIRTIHEAGHNAIWVGTLNGAARFDRTKFTEIDLDLPLTSREVLSIFQTRAGVTWFGTRSGVIRYDRGTQDWLTAEDGLLEGSVNAILETADGDLWFGTENGLSRYNGRTFVNYTTADGLPSRVVSSIEPASDDTLWVTTTDGFARFDPMGFTQWTDKDGLLRPDGKPLDVSVLEADSNDALWLGTPAELLRFDAATLQIRERIGGFSGIRDLHRTGDGTVWISDKKGIWKLDAGQPSVVFEKPDVISLDSDPNGHVWFVTGGNPGLVGRLNPSSGDLRTFEVPDRVVEMSRSIRYGPDDRVWVGGFTGLFVLDGNEMIDIDDRRSPQDPEGHAVWSIHAAPDGTVRFGGSRLFARYDGKTVDFLDQRMGVAEPKVSDIAQSPDGILWLATQNHGLVGFDGTAFTAIDAREGLAAKELRAVETDSRGQVWVATKAGLTRYRRATESPTVRLVSVQIDNDTLTNLTTRVQVLAGHRLTVSYQELDYKTHREKRQFILRLNSQNQPQVPGTITKLRNFDWTPRKPGDYTLDVQAIDRDLNYSKPARLHIQVVAPWYLNPWIAAPTGGSAIGLVMLSLLTGWRYFVHRRAAEGLQQQMLLQERRARETLEQSNRRLEEAKEAAEEARESAEYAREAAEIANRAKSIFLANMSHEIRTPLNAILGYAQILRRDGKLDPAQHESVSTIERSGNHLLALINEILDLSKIESGRMELSIADFDLREMIVGLSEMFQLRCRQKRLEWLVEGAGDLPIPVRGDEGKLRQTLINLLGNAVKFTDRGRVILRFETRGNDIYSFSVIDTGPGIAPEMHAKILEPFTQGIEGKHKGGTGLGLAISRRQVELMGGELRLESEPGNGSRFFFSVHLPAATGAIAPRTKPAERKARRLLAGTKVTALIADDVAENRRVLEHVLTALGVTVTVVATGGEALSALLQHPFDIAFLDIQMPDMTGTEVAERFMRERGSSNHAKLVAISASVLQHEQKEYAEKGFEGFIPKPFRFEQICHCLSDLLGTQFEYEDDAEKSDAVEPTAPAPDVPRIMLPEELSLRLRHAAEMYSVTEFETYLSEIEAIGPAGKELADRLRQLSKNVRFEEIVEILNNIGTSE